MNIADWVRVLNVTGQSVNFVGGFLLTVEALRVARIASTAEKLRQISDLMTSSLGKHDPLPLRFSFAIACTVITVVIVTLAPFLIAFALTPALFAILYLVHRPMRWAIKLTADGYVSVVGFAFVSAGAALQLVATLL